MYVKTIMYKSLSMYDTNYSNEQLLCIPWQRCCLAQETLDSALGFW